MNTGRFLIWGAIILLVIPAGVAFIESTDVLSASAPAPTVNDIYIVQPEQAITVESDGDIEAENRLALSFQVAGEIRELYAEEGDPVEAGDVIAILKNERQRVSLANAEVQLQVAQLQLEDLIEVDDDEIRLAEARIQAAMDSYGFTANQVTQEDIRVAELNYQSALDTLDAAQAARIRGGGNMDEEGVQLLEAQIGEASFDAEIARLQLENLRTRNNPNLGAAGAQIEQAEAQLARVIAGPTEFQVRDAELAVDAAERNVEQARIAFERTVLTAPQSGVLTDIRAEVGQTVGPGQPLMQLVDVEPLHLLAQVDEIDIDSVEVGMAARVTLDALPGLAFDAEVTRVAQNGQDVRGVTIYETEVELLQPDARIRPGMSGTAYIEARPAGNTLIVPETFLIAQDDDTTAVNVVSSTGYVQTVTVTTGDTTPLGIEVLSGVATGDALLRPIAQPE